MADNDEQQTLQRILGELQSGDATRCLSGIQALGTLNYSSPAILRQLEKLAIYHTDPEVRRSATQALSSPVHRFVRAKWSRLNPRDRGLLLQQIREWQEDGLLEANTADVIRRRYDFDMATASEPRPAQPTPQEPAVSAPPAAPRPSLTQTLLSEASIKIYLYLGAFFVIASALILAALVQAARLPILAAATLAFGGVALALRKRLPQPSFALFIVFSFLLPIDANVLEQTIRLREPALSVYWTVIFLAMAVIWGFSVWFYRSRFFSAVAFIALSLAFYRAGKTFRTEKELQILLVMIAALVGLAAAFLLRKWKDSRFSLLLFELTQLQVLGLLLTSFILAVLRAFRLDPVHGWWLVIAVTWLSATGFYVWSDRYSPGVLFRWLAVAALFPLPWFLLEAAGAKQPAYAWGFCAWGMLLAFSSEAALRLPFERLKKYHWALLAVSVPLFLTAFVIALLWDQPGLSFAIFTLAALAYTGLHVLRRRWYVWSAALLCWLLAYFTFFSLLLVADLEVALLPRLWIASLLLLVPELFVRAPLSRMSQTRWPAIVLGILVSMFGISLAIGDLDHTGRGALALLVYSVLFGLHALHNKQEWLGYFATALESLALVYALDHFDLDLWLPGVTLLAVLYYATGFFFRRMEGLKAWGRVFVNSGLALGLLLSLTCLALVKETSGWYLIGIALLFLIETFARPLRWLEVAVEGLLSFALYLILKDFGVKSLSHFLFGASLLWLGGDLLFGRLTQGGRSHRPITLGAGYVLIFIAALALWGERNAVVPSVYFLLYVVFFAFYAFSQNRPALGYLATAFLALGVIKLSGSLQLEKWIFPLIALAVAYYLSGDWLRRREKVRDWGQMLLYSGLGVGVLTCIAAPFQGGPAASIPVAIAATLFAAEALARRNVWWALPADLLYLMSYFMILAELKVDEPQFYSVGAALLGMLMHYLLTRAGSKTGAFIIGMLSQLVLLGTTYIQMVTAEEASFFFMMSFVLFIQFIIVLVYGIIQHSRSLVITPIAFAVLEVVTLVYSTLKGLGPVILIGFTGIILLAAGIAAVLMRERITRLGEQLSDWRP